MKRRRLVAACAVTLLLTACNGDSEATTTTDAALPDVTSTTAAETVTTTSFPPAEPHELDMTSEEICDTVPEERVAEVLMVTVDESIAFEDASPQCSYQFLLEDGSVNNAIVNVPTINGNLRGASGDEGFEYILSLYEGGNYTETETDAGDRSLVLSSPPDADAGVHVGLIQVGERIIITIVSVGLVDYDGFLDLNHLAVEYLTP